MFKIKHEFYLFSNSATMMVSPPTAISRHLAGRGDPPSDREDLVLALLRAGVVFTTLPRFCCSLGRAFMELPLLMGTFLEVVELCLSGERSFKSGNSGRRLGRYSERDIIDTYLSERDIIDILTFFTYINISNGITLNYGKSMALEDDAESMRNN